MLRRIKEILDYIKGDVHKQDLEDIFPMVNNVYYLDYNGDSEFIYVRKDDDTFHVAKHLGGMQSRGKHGEDISPEISADELLLTIQQSDASLDPRNGDREVRIQDTPKGYDVTLIELE